MPIREKLRAMLGQVEGAFAVTLMGYDCIAIDEVKNGDAGFDVHAMTVEFGTVVKELRHTINVVGAGKMEEIIITTGSARVIIRILNDEFFAAFALPREASLGKARYTLRVNALSLIEALS